MRLRKRRVSGPTAFGEAKVYCMLGRDQDGFELKFIDKTIGHGVFTTKPFEAGNFLLEYREDLVSHKEGLRREKMYKPSDGSFLFFFKDRQQGTKCIDATKFTGCGRMVNDATQPLTNCKVMTFYGCADGRTCLCLFASKDISIGSELRFDYGVTDLPWRKKEPPYPAIKVVEETTQQTALKHLTFCGLKMPQSSPKQDGHRKRALKDDAIVSPTDTEEQSTVSSGGGGGGNEKAGIQQKPSRPCAFCGIMQTQLLRHLKRWHVKEEAVKAAFKLPRPDRMKAIADIRKEGVYLENVRRVQTNGELKILSQRDQGTDDKVMCGGCKGFYSRHRIWKHKRECSDSAVKHSSIPVSSLVALQSSERDGKFCEKILCRFRDDAVGNICRTDSLIIKLGRKLWSKSYRRDRHVIMNDMRRMGKLLYKFQSVSGVDKMCGEDMINRRNFSHLETAIEEITKKENDQVKAGLKLSIGFLLKTVAKVMKANCIIEDRLADAEETDRFLAVLDLNWGFLFGRCQLDVEAKRQAVLRKPQAMPLEKDVVKVKEFTVDSMSKILNDPYIKWDSHIFNWMRSLIVCRLTLFNARRGGEPSRLTLKEWEDAENEAWVDPQMVQHVDDPLQKLLLHTFKLAYQSGKGSKKLVPCLMPKDTLYAIRALVENRDDAGVSSENVFLFPYTQKSLDHVHGWFCIKEVTQAMEDELEKPQLLTATRFRHRASTLYALLDVSENERSIFYKHMGHSADINQNIYQCPLAIKEITSVGRYLTSIDGASTSTGLGKKQMKPNRHRSSESTPGTSRHSDGSDYHHPPTKQKKGARRHSDDSDDSDYHPPTKQKKGARRHSDDSDDNDYHPPTKQKKGFKTRKQSCVSSDTDDSQPLTNHVKGRKYTRWAPADAWAIRKAFVSFVEDSSSKGTKGSLPGKREVEAFICKNPDVLHGVSDKEKVLLIKTKVFNERTKQRRKLMNKLVVV